jgi:uncharacterized membrane protein (TIGR02234 family)
MTGRRGLLIALTGCVVGGALVLLAGGREWGSALVTAETGARSRVGVTGHAAAPALPALGLALLVFAGAIVAAREWLRRLVGLLLVIVGGAVVGMALSSGHDVAAALRRRAFGVQHLVVHGSVSGWAVVAAVGGAVAVLAGALTVVVGARWPAMGARYDAPAARDAVPAGNGPAEPAVAWDALDRGDDPTL